VRLVTDWLLVSDAETSGKPPAILMWFATIRLSRVFLEMRISRLFLSAILIASSNVNTPCAAPVVDNKTNVAIMLYLYILHVYLIE
jgi:hypothetical protein